MGSMIEGGGDFDTCRRSATVMGRMMRSVSRAGASLGAGRRDHRRFLRRSGGGNGRREGPGRRRPHRRICRRRDEARRAEGRRRRWALEPGRAGLQATRSEEPLRRSHRRRRCERAECRFEPGHARRQAAPRFCLPASVEAQEKLIAAMRIESGGRDLGFESKNLEAGDGEHRKRCALGKTLGRAQAHTNAGKAAGAVHDDDCIELAELQFWPRSEALRSPRPAWPNKCGPPAPFRRRI